MDRPDLVALRLGVPLATWTDLGFAVQQPGSRCRVGGVELLLGAAGEGDGVIGWQLAGVSAGSIDGLPTLPAHSARPSADGGGHDHRPTSSAHPNGAAAIDHVVVATPDVARTLRAFEAAGMAVRRQRDAGSADRPLRQAFLLTRQALVEVVGPPEPAGDEPASFWGLTVAVADLDATAVLLGERLSAVRDAVQPGRRIATVRREAAGGMHLAFMDLRV